MPVIEMEDRQREVAVHTTYLGIDPGLGGGLAVLRNGQLQILKMPPTERDLWDFLYQLEGEVCAVIEQQIPRPTSYFDKETGRWRASILKSTCLLYGSYMSLRAMLIAADIRFEETPPKRWQKALSIPPKKRGESLVQWKNRLKAKGQQLYPSTKVTLAVADAILLVEYCRRQNGRG